MWQQPRPRLLTLRLGLKSTRNGLNQSIKFLFLFKIIQTSSRM